MKHGSLRTAPLAPAVAVLVLALGFLVHDPAAAQRRLSFHAGMSVATLAGSGSEGRTSRSGVAFGVAAAFGLAPNLSLQAGATYTEKGGRQEAQGVSAELGIDYLDVPLLLRVGLPSAGTLSPYVFAGPFATLKVTCNATVTAQGLTASGRCDSADFPVHTFDWGLMGGAGVDIATSGLLSLSVEVIYGAGMTSIVDPSIAGELKTRTWSIMAGVGVPLGDPKLRGP